MQMNDSPTLIPFSEHDGPSPQYRISLDVKSSHRGIAEDLNQ
jgi:hypothetical protein